MATEEVLNEIIKKLGNNRSKLSALFSLYNNSMLVAEENRNSLSACFEQMIDFKNDLNLISTQILGAKKSERETIYNKNKSKIKMLNKQVGEINNNFNDSCVKYKLALAECGSLKTEYTHEVSILCKQFKSSIDESTPSIIIKGYKQQIKIIKAILDRIELLISDYNVKKNKIEIDNTRFNELFTNINSLIERLQQIA